MTFNSSEDNSQMKNNIIEQASRASEILMHAGNFKAYYNDLTNNIIDCMNNQISQYVVASKRAIQCDIYDQVIESINFDELKKRFKADMHSLKSGGSLTVPKMKHVSNRDNILNGMNAFDIDEYDSDILVSMYSNLDTDKKTLKKFAKFQDAAINNLTDVIDNVGTFEAQMCEYRTRITQDVMKDVEALYAMHVNYANDLVHKRNPDNTVTVGNITFKLEKSQRTFIENALKQIVGI